LSRRRVFLGREGEDAALKYLQQKGYLLLDKNFRCSAGELDLVMLDGRQLVFVEVRTRKSRDFGTPEESITVTKQRQVKKVALAYLAGHKLPPGGFRFDVVAVDYSGGSREIRHLPHAF